MDQSRYRDKSYLVTYDLTTDIFDAFNLELDDIVPIRSVYMLYTNQGMKILKKVNYGIDDLLYLDHITNHIIENGYPYVVPFMKTKCGEFYLETEDGIYVVLDLVEGREADYQNPIDISMISKALCRLHIASRGINEAAASRNKLYSWVPSFEKRASEFLKFKEIAELHQIKSGFDRLYLEYVDKFYDDAEKSIMLLKSSQYRALCDMASKMGNICHHDLAYHNIIIDIAGNVYFVDFDYSILDLRVHDISNLIVKSIRNCNWDLEKAMRVIENYCSIEKISSDEFDVLYDFMVFPQDFYDISKCYYMRTKKWDEDYFLLKLEARTGCYNDRKEFLDSFKEAYLRLK